MDLDCPLLFMSQISWHMCDIFKISHCVHDSHLFNWCFVTWNFKTHFHLVISSIPQPTYICLLILLYHLIASSVPSFSINFILSNDSFHLWFFYYPVFVTLSTAPQTFIRPLLHITFRCHTFTFVLTKNYWRQPLCKIALVNTFSHILITHCHGSTKGLG